jgi:hypothetical protein
MTRQLRAGMGLLCLIAIAGCGSTGTVSGKVTFKDKPLTVGEVVFTTDEGGHVFRSDLSQDGSYRVSGIPPGSVKITITTPYPAEGTGGRPGGPPGRPGGPPGGGGPPAGHGQIPTDKLPPGVGTGVFDPNKIPEGAVKIPDKYRDAEKSGLTYTVKSGSQTFDIPLQ